MWRPDWRPGRRRLGRLATGGDSGASHLDQGGKRTGVTNGQIGEHLSVDLDLGGPQPGDKPAVAHAVETRGGVDALNPELAKVTLTGPTVAVGVLERVENLLVGGAIAPALVAEVSLGLLEYGTVVLLAVYGALYPGHHMLLSG
jgi:hypothetical protein